MLEFRSNSVAHRPVLDALALVERYAKAGNTIYYPLGELLLRQSAARASPSPCPRVCTPALHR